VGEKQNHPFQLSFYSSLKVDIRGLRVTSARLSACSVLLFVMLISSGLSADIPLPKSYDFPSKQQVIKFLTESIDWYRHLSVERQIATEPSDLLFLDDNQPIGTQVVQLSFAFARADASLAATFPAPASEQGGAAIADASSSDFKHFVEMKTKSDDASRQASEDLESIKKKLLTARRADRKTLEAALAETQSRLELLQARSTSLRDLVEFIRATGSGGPQTADLGSIIDDLARTVPEVTNPPALLAALSTQNSHPSSVPKPPDPGIRGLTSEVSTLERKLRTLDEAVRLTDKLAHSSQSLRTPFAGFINQVVQSGDLEASNLQATNLDALRRQKARLDALAVQIQKLSPAIEALDKQRVLLTVYKSNLGKWRIAVVGQYRNAWKNLILRLVVLGAVVASLAGIGEALRRVTVYYVRDANRRRMMLVVQRIVIWFAIILVVAFAFASDLSSLATYFGLLTAGIAVALQNVILAVLGYFLLVGKLGIRLGDRVQISGVTGYVIDIGLLQFQLREVDTKEQLTGRIVSFSNSFVFVSPATGLFKLVPDSARIRE